MGTQSQGTGKKELFDLPFFVEGTHCLTRLVCFLLRGKLGTGYGLAVDMYAMAEVPSPIEADELLGRRVVKIAAGHSHAACITESGELFFWGSTLHLEPERVVSLLHTKVRVLLACVVVVVSPFELLLLLLLLLSYASV